MGLHQRRHQHLSSPLERYQRQITQLDASKLPPSAVNAAYRLKHFLARQQQQKNPSSLSLYAASEKNRFTNFDGQHSEKAQLNLTQQINEGNWSAQLSLNHETNGKNHFDQSYISYQFDDWSLRLGALDQWWGPAQSSSLILSNNARPIPTVALSRSQAVESQSSWLRFLGPWYFTAQLGQLEGNRAIPDTKLWLTRFSFKPISGLEVGASWTAMWGGKGQGNGLSDLFDVLTFKAECVDGTKNCDDALHTKKGNHLAGFDVKYSFMLFEQPVNLYAQRIGEDAANYYKVTDHASLYGISSYIGSTKVYIETSDTTVACDNNKSGVKNCYYEHSDYTSGYRFHQRAIGSTFDSDAKMLTVGMNKHFFDGDVLEVFVRRLNLNKDQQKPSPVVEGLSEKLLQVGGFYQTTFADWQIKVGGQIERSEVDKQDNDTNSMFYTELQYRVR